MDASINLAGKINVGVDYLDGYIRKVNVQSSRPTELTRLLEGKSPDEVIQRVPLLYSLCSCAQTIAALMAIESAQGRLPDLQVLQARKLLLLAETTKELGLRLGRDWLDSANLLNLPELLNWFADFRTQLAWCLQINPSVPEKRFPLPRFISELEGMLKNITGPDELQFKEAVYVQSQTHPIGKAVADLSDKYDGISLGPACPEMDLSSDYLDWQLSLRGQSFCALPQGEGGCFETSIWTRNCKRSMIKESNLLTINPIAQRFLALLLELKAMPHRLLQVDDEELIRSDKPGFAWVEAARGALIHRVTMTINPNGDEQISQYRIIAPTEWNFHPQGTLVSMLEGVKVPEDKAADLVGKLILSVDPCVAYEVEVN
ncbi:nickel-dependent hydrogenase large subunit [Neptuniibacter sp. QD34_54]|uniref:nickel-dependent hydrogenase large subunit n=1 Tax=Neptuniibacter sp. QD34_54 TaxID=3398208 RepID=UPI0039F5BF4A